MSKITIDLDKIAPAITDSIRAVLTSYGLHLHQPTLADYQLEKHTHVNILTDRALRQLLSEMGRNAAQAVVAHADDDTPPCCQYHADGGMDSLSCVHPPWSVK